MGGSPKERGQRYRERSPIEMLPSAHSTKSSPAACSPPRRAYVEAAKRAGDTVNATVAAQSGHFVFINPGSSTCHRWSKQSVG
jgi:hypothetical protein